MPKSLRQRLEEAEAERDELQEIVDDYEEKFEAISEQLPEKESDDDED